MKMRSKSAVEHEILLRVFELSQVLLMCELGCSRSLDTFRAVFVEEINSPISNPLRRFEGIHLRAQSHKLNDRMASGLVLH